MAKRHKACGGGRTPSDEPFAGITTCGLRAAPGPGSLASGIAHRPGPLRFEYEKRYGDTSRRASNPDLAVVGPVWEALHARLAAEEGWETRFAAADAGIVGTEFGWDRVAL
ncbi:hypothetical protein [Streptomyces phaeochromogenes]|uniref:hypothetical protein n=1 Tax=Streptomyces phaeochromogenes TaxID=1923 RepID=UPI0034030197